MTHRLEESSETPERSENFEAKRMEILRRSAIIFADQGYRETSVNTLAEKLGVSKPVLYYYAKNKNDLLHQCCLIAHNQLKQAIDSAAESYLTGLGKIRHFFVTYAKIMASDFGRCYVLIDVRALPPGLREQELRSRRAIEQAVKHMLIEGQSDGSIRQCDPAFTARAMFGAFNGIPRWFRASGRSDISDIVDLYLDTFMFGIARFATDEPPLDPPASAS